MGVLVVGLLLVVGCNRAEKETETCRRNLWILYDSSRSYSLENRLSFDTVINPADMKMFYPHLEVPICPSGNAPYAPFKPKDGSVCPNDPKHTAKFKEMHDDVKRNYPKYP
jgi:hypothetical protein